MWPIVYTLIRIIYKDHTPSVFTRFCAVNVCPCIKFVYVCVSEFITGYTCEPIKRTLHCLLISFTRKFIQNNIIQKYDRTISR